MDRKEFKEEFKYTLENMFNIMEKKNADYTKSDPFGNFKLVESLGITTVEKGILVRMADKMSRISTLMDQEAMVKDEAIEDTLQDLANYSIILKLYLQNVCKKHDDNYNKGGIDISKLNPFEYDLLSGKELFKTQTSICYMDNGIEKTFKSIEKYEKFLINKYKNHE